MQIKRITMEEARELYPPLYTTTSTSCANPCNHGTGWYVTVKFWIFSKRIFVCSDCGYSEERK